MPRSISSRGQKHLDHPISDKTALTLSHSLRGWEKHIVCWQHLKHLSVLYSVCEHHLDFPTELVNSDSGANHQPMKYKTGVELIISDLNRTVIHWLHGLKGQAQAGGQLERIQARVVHCNCNSILNDGIHCTNLLGNN